ncbi:TonB-dependent receptor [candidate division WOR-3 bacterium]|nr:TonB-dependent receptor [candidate division WOR-3 bacterium]
MVAVVCLLLTVSLLSAEDVTYTPRGKIAGRVLDASTRTPLFGAAVSLLNQGLGSFADKNGIFIITDVPAGTYSVEASMISYRTQVKTTVVVEPGRTTELIFKLSQSALDVEGVSIRPDYFPKVRDAAVSEQSFSADEIEMSPGGICDVQRVVQALPSVSSGADYYNEIVVRGGNPNENLFLVDGVEFAYPNHFGSYMEQGGAINLINPLLIREVDFIAGAFPARYGDRASSVMDISLKRGSRQGIDGNIDMGMGGVGGVIEGPLPGGIGSFMGSYHKSFLELFALLGLFENTAIPYYTNCFGKVSLNVSPSNEIFALSLAGWDRMTMDMEEMLGMPLTVKMESFKIANGVGWQALFRDLGYGRLTLYESVNRWGQTQYFTGDEADTFYFHKADAQAWGARYDATVRWLSTQETQAGVNFTYEPFGYSFYYKPDTTYTYIYDPVDSTLIDSSIVIDPETGEPMLWEMSLDEETSSWKLGGYLQHKVRIGKVADLTLGLRGDYFRYTDNFYLSPRLGFSTEPLLLGFSFHAGYGWHYQSPVYYILLADSANHDLASRRSDHYVLGIERLLTDDIKLSIEGYYKQIHNLPVMDDWYPSIYAPNTRWYDYGRGQAKGIELLIQKKYAKNWHGTVSYSFSDSRQTNPYDTSIWIPSDYDFRHSFTIVGAYRFEFMNYDWYQRLPSWFRESIGGMLFGDQADLGFRWRYLAGRPYTPMVWDKPTRTWTSSAELVNSERLPPYHRLDLRWQMKRNFKGFSLSAYIDVQNVYNRINVWEYTYMPDSNKVAVNQQGIIPAGGFVIEF